MEGYDFDKEAETYKEFVRNNKEDSETTSDFAEKLIRKHGAVKNADGTLVVFRLPGMHSHLTVPRGDSLLFRGSDKEGTFHISDELNNTESKYREYYKYDTLKYSTSDNNGNKPRLVAAAPAKGKVGLSAREMMAAKAPAAPAVNPEIARLEARIDEYEDKISGESNAGKIKNYQKEVAKAKEALAKLKGSARRKTRRSGQDKYRAKSLRVSDRKKKTRRTR